MSLTVGDNMHKALSTAEGLKAQIETFGHDTNDKTAKAEFYRVAQALEAQIIPALRNRTNFIEQQEPQFSIKQEAYQEAQNAQQPQG